MYKYQQIRQNSAETAVLARFGISPQKLTFTDESTSKIAFFIKNQLKTAVFLSFPLEKARF